MTDDEIRRHRDLITRAAAALLGEDGFDEPAPERPARAGQILTFPSTPRSGTTENATGGEE
jgi:hypothetical protein